MSMTVNTINELLILLNQVDIDAQVLAAISNDSANSTQSGLSAGYVTTRLGAEVKNVQKIIQDIEDGVSEEIRPAILDEGFEILPGPRAIDFIGPAVTVTDTTTVDGSKVAITVNIDADMVADAATTNKFTTAGEIAKLAGIEELADVTDAINVDAAGAVMNTDATTAAMAFVIDEDTMATDSATLVPTQQSVKAYVDTEITNAVLSSVQYRGGYNASTNTPDLDTSPVGVSVGDMYTVTAAGTFFAAALEIGDVLIAEIDDPALQSDWTILNRDLDAASIKVSYESNADTNAFTDAEQTKLSGLTAGATLGVITQDEGGLIDADATTLNFVGAGVVASDAGGGVTTVTVSGAAAGTVTATGTPVDNQIGVWTGADTIEGTSGLTYNGLTLSVTGDMAVSGTILSDLQAVDQLVLQINASTGVADPVDALSGDPFDNFESLFAWVVKRYSQVGYVYCDVAAGTYTSTKQFLLPAVISRFEFYGDTTATTILDLAGNGIRTTQSQEITFGVCTLNDVGQVEVGGLYLFECDLNMSGQWMYITGGMAFNGNPSASGVQANASVIHISNITFSGALGGAIIVSNTQLVLSNNVTIDVTAAINGKGYVIRAENALLYLDSDANIDIQDRLASSPVDGEILIAQGATYIQHPSAVFTVGSVTYNDDNWIPTKSEIKPLYDAEGNTVNAQTGTTYTLALADLASIVTMNNAAANTLTIPSNAAVAFPIGTMLTVTQLGAGITTIAGDTGVTLTGNGGSVSAGSTAIQTQYNGVVLIKIATDQWLISGDIAVVA